jgi:Membrane bound beta barrel domain (DUF5777)
LEEETNDEVKIEYAYATFKATRIVNSQSIENVPKKDLLFVIQHRFGNINDGIYEFFGLDNPTIRFGLDYGINDRITIGVGRSSFQKTYDGYLKVKLTRQVKGEKNFPLGISFFSSASYLSLKPFESEGGLNTSQRMAYVNELLFARKFSSKFSFQLTPALVHRNYVTAPQPNDIWALGAGGRIKLTQRVSLNLDYVYQFNNPDKGTIYYDMISVGFDIETGGHVFSLHVTNSDGMTERYFIAETTGDILNGDLFFGFNISRVFHIGKK